MALQPKIIACGNTVASFAMAVRFLTGPAVMAAASIAVGLRGTLLHVAIVQVQTHLFTFISYASKLFFSLYNFPSQNYRVGNLKISSLLRSGNNLFAFFV